MASNETKFENKKLINFYLKNLKNSLLHDKIEILFLLHLILKQMMK